MPPNRSYSLPLLPLSPLPLSNSFQMLSRKDKGHKFRSSSSKIHRRSRSSNILLSTFQKISHATTQNDRSTMSLCSVTSDEYDMDDTIMDSFDNTTFEVDDGQSSVIHPASSSPPTFPLFTRENHTSTTISQESWVVTPPTPSRLTLKMRPSTFVLPFKGNDFYTSYDDSDDYSDDEFVYTINERSREYGDSTMTNSYETTLPPHQIPITISTTESSHDTIVSESESFDENDDNENSVPPSTPPSNYQDDHVDSRFMSSPPIIRLIPKRIIYLPFHSHDNYGPSDYISTGSAMDNYNERSTATLSNQNLHHLLLPDDF